MNDIIIMLLKDIISLNKKYMRHLSTLEFGAAITIFITKMIMNNAPSEEIGKETIEEAVKIGYLQSKEGKEKKG